MAECKIIIALKTFQSKVTNNENTTNEDLRSQPPRKVLQQVKHLPWLQSEYEDSTVSPDILPPSSKIFDRKNSLGKRKSGCILDSARADNALHSRAGDERTGGNTGGGQGQNEQSFLHHLAGFSEK